MYTIDNLINLKDGDGATLKNWKSITYKTGYQVATEGIECKNPIEAMKSIKAYNGNCGIWKENGIYYIDKSRRISTKKEAVKLGNECNQISILQWNNMNLIYLK